MAEFDLQVTSLYECVQVKTENIADAQKSDNEIQELINILQSGGPHDLKDPKLRPYKVVFRKLYVEDGILMKRRDDKGVPVVPEGKIHVLLKSIHSGIMGAHFGISKCYYKLVDRFYFPCMVPRLAEFINSCEFCLKRKMPKMEPRPAINPIAVDHRDIGGLVSYDFKGPLPCSQGSKLYPHKCRYILVVIDHATKYSIGHACPTMESSVVAEVMLGRWIPLMGVPRMVLSDRARTFSGTVMRTIYKALGVEVVHTAAYNPNCNGLVEQQNRLISNLLFVMLEESADEWPKQLNLLFSAYNASPQSATGYSPNFLVLGREIIEPTDFMLYQQAAQDAKGQRAFEELEDRMRLRRRALELLQLKFEEKREKTYTESKEKQKVDKFQIGEMVGFKAPPGPSKLIKKYELNHKVVKIIGEDTYVLRNMDTGYERIINARKMRKIGVGDRWGDQQKLKDKALNVISDFSEDDDDEAGLADAPEAAEMEHGETKNAPATETGTPTELEVAENEDQHEDKQTVILSESQTVGGDPWIKRLRDRKMLRKPIRL